LRKFSRLQLARYACPLGDNAAAVSANFPGHNWLVKRSPLGDNDAVVCVNFPGHNWLVEWRTPLAHGSSLTEALDSLSDNRVLWRNKSAPRPLAVVERNGCFIARQPRGGAG